MLSWLLLSSSGIVISNLFAVITVLAVLNKGHVARFDVVHAVQGFLVRDGSSNFVTLGTFVTMIHHSVIRPQQICTARAGPAVTQCVHTLTSCLQEP
jgi:hypothetical protein